MIAARILFFTSLLLFGAIAGFFYAYWCSVMVGFDAAKPDVAIAAMQAINATVRNVYFAPAFFGPLLVAPLAALAAYRLGSRRSAGLMAAAAAVYALGAFLPTVMYNVPLNNALALQSAAAADAATIWKSYADAWNIGNALRMAMSFISLLFTGWAIATLERSPARKEN